MSLAGSGMARERGEKINKNDRNLVAEVPIKFGVVDVD